MNQFTSDEIRETFDAYIAATTARPFDYERYIDCFAEHVDFADWGLSAHIVGRREDLGAAVAGFSEFVVPFDLARTGPLSISGNTAMSEFVWTIPTALIRDILEGSSSKVRAEDCAEIRVPVVSVMELNRDRKIVRYRDFFNPLSISGPLGLSGDELVQRMLGLRNPNNA
ncbi:MAG TPA: hypothetical protein VJQ47_03495 [Steroidobacteraceae bacterium]|nr:hypothetical protein [Steroidobacteraceae bacterium]